MASTNYQCAGAAKDSNKAIPGEPIAVRNSGRLSTIKEHEDAFAKRIARLNVVATARIFLAPSSSDSADRVIYFANESCTRPSSSIFATTSLTGGRVL